MRHFPAILTSHRSGFKIQIRLDLSMILYFSLKQISDGRETVRFETAVLLVTLHCLLKPIVEDSYDVLSGSHTGTSSLNTIQLDYQKLKTYLGSLNHDQDSDKEDEIMRVGSATFTSCGIFGMTFNELLEKKEYKLPQSC